MAALTDALTAYPVAAGLGSQMTCNSMAKTYDTKEKMYVTWFQDTPTDRRSLRKFLQKGIVEW